MSNWEEGTYPGYKTNKTDRTAKSDGIHGLDDRARSADFENMVDSPAVGL